MRGVSAENIFISYRRDDTSAYAGRICDHLNALIGSHRVFMDLEDIHPGQNFARAIDQTLARSTTVLVIVGPRWVEILRERAARNEEDYVVHEISAALTAKKNVVPVLVGGAVARVLTNLPPSLVDLPFHQAVELHDSSFKDDCAHLAKALHLTRRFSSISWPATALLVSLAILALAAVAAARVGVGPWRSARGQNIRVAQMLQTAASQSTQQEYESAFRSYQQVLDLDPTDHAAQEGQLVAAMQWLEHFHVLTPEGQKSEDLAAPILAELKTVLEAGLARTSGHDQHAADILAHLGWAHWMNEKIAFKEFDNAERFFVQSLAVDPSNVFAHAFMGNWLLQKHGDSSQALVHIQAALTTNRQRALVRAMQLGGLRQNDAPGMRAAFIIALNDVRIHNEPLDKNLRDRLSYLYSPTVNRESELRETLAAVPPEDAWKTFVWLTADRSDDTYERALRDFIHAQLTELAGDRTAALAELKALKAELESGHVNGRMVDYTEAAIKRVSR